MLNGRSDQPLFTYDHSVRFTIRKGNEVVISQRLLHWGDWLDPAYYILYPQHAWDSENVLHLYNEYYFRDGTAGTVVIKNTSMRTIRYALIKASDAHLILDLTPGAQTTIRIPGRGDSEWFAFEWLNADDSVVHAQTQGFRKDKSTPSVCSIEISGAEASIECPELARDRSQD